MDAMSLGARRFSLPHTPVPADATRVALPTVNRKESTLPGVGIKQPNLPPRHETYIGPADPNAMSRAEADAHRRSQESVDAMCTLDPFAAQVNGMRNFGNQARPHWQRIGPSPLEYAASMAQPKVLTLFNVARGVAEAVHEPNAVNVTAAAIGAGSMLLGGMANVKGLPSGLHQVAEGAERVHQGFSFAETGGAVENLRKTFHSEPQKAHKHP